MQKIAKDNPDFMQKTPKMNPDFMQLLKKIKNHSNTILYMLK